MASLTVGATWPRELVMWTALDLVLASVLLFSLGHRLRRSSWLLSLITILGIAASAQGFERALTGSSLPAVPVLVLTLVVGVVFTQALETWNPIGHAAFTAVCLAVVGFLTYAGFVLVAARLGPLSLIFGIVLLVLQVGALSLLVAHTFETIDAICRTRNLRAPQPAAPPDYRPMVSLHVPTHNEPPGLVIETLDALAALDYPRYEVLVIDNNTADESLWRPVEEHCKRLGDRFRFFHLMPWPGYKSGALNFALSQTALEAEIVGIVDADYVAEPAYLHDLVGYFANPRMAFVQTPQDYRDADERGRFGRALCMSYSYFFKVSMSSRDQYNAIIFAGTMGLIRRRLLEDLGGWDEWCITEDAELSLRLLDAGYESVFVDRTYGRGLMPLDYAGLKKQRFRWAFGGMQLLRKHVNALFNPWSGGRLTFAQRFAYVSGALQWLNDPLTLAFTFLLLLSAAALMTGGSIFHQSLVGAVVLVPPLFILFAVLRFLWAFRLRASCSWSEAIDALTILLGLTWVVTLACVRGLTSKHGVFLRTPKQGDRPAFMESMRVVWWELMLAVTCVALCAALLVTQRVDAVSVQGVGLVFLLWQAVVYASAVRSSLWNYAEARQRLPMREPRSFRTQGHGLGRFLTERRAAVRVAVPALALTGLFVLALVSAPPLERAMRSDPLRQFLPARSVLPVAPDERVGSVLQLESAAAREGDVRSAMALWDSDGAVVDANMTPDDPTDDHVWHGEQQIRERYEEEFRLRHYRTLRHEHLATSIQGDTAFVRNDLRAVYATAEGVEAVRRTGSDQWTLRRRRDRWRIVRLEVNRSPAVEIRGGGHSPLPASHNHT